MCYAGDPEKQKVIYSTVGRFLSEVDSSESPRRPAHPIRGQVPGVGQARIDGLIGARRFIERQHGWGNPVASAGRSSVRGDRPSPRRAHPRVPVGTHPWVGLHQHRVVGPEPGRPHSREKDFQMKLGAHLLDCTGSAAAGGAAGGSTRGAQRRAHRLRQWEGCRNGGLSHRRHGKHRPAYSAPPAIRRYLKAGHRHHGGQQ